MKTISEQSILEFAQKNNAFTFNTICHYYSISGKAWQNSRVVLSQYLFHLMSKGKLAYNADTGRYLLRCDISRKP